MPTKLVEIKDEYVGKPNWLEKITLSNSYMDLYNKFADRFNSNIEQWNSEADEIFDDCNCKEYRLFIYEKCLSILDGIYDKCCYGTVIFDESGFDEFGCHDFMCCLLKDPKKGVKRYYKDI